MPVATFFLAFMVGVPHTASGGVGSAAKEERDIWRDEAVLRFIQTDKHGTGQSAKERDRVYRRAKAYRWMGDNVFKQLPGGKLVVVPRTAERESIVLGTRRGMGHYGVHRVLDRLQQN